MKSSSSSRAEQVQDTRSPDEFDLFDPEIASEPYAFYKALHDRCPVYKVPGRGFYLISRYDDLDHVLRDYGTYSNVIERSAVLQGDKAKYFQDVLRTKGWEHMPTLQRTDPPQHTRYRKIIDAAFNFRQVRELGPHLAELANHFIDKFIDRGECEFIDEFALPFPGTVIAEMIGLDPKDYRTFKKWSANLMAYATRVMSAEELHEAGEIEVEMQHFLAGVLEDRRKNPRDDLMTGLVTACEGVEPLTMREAQNILAQLMAGGYETLTSALAHGLWQMIRFPEVTEEVRSDRSLMRAFINESLRFESPVQGLYRTTTKDTELGGMKIPAGSTCNVRYGAANRDESQFPHANQFDLHRENANLHLAFGAPPHFCPGAVLARAEMTVAFNAILDRMEDLQLVRPLPYPVHHSSGGFIPMKELPVRFRKRAS